jgi:hypothetical protein
MAIEGSHGQGREGRRGHKEACTPPLGFPILFTPLPDSHILRGCEGEIREFFCFDLQEGL